MRYSTFTKDDENRFLALTEGGGAATFIYSRGVAHGGKLSVYDENDRDIRTIAISGTVYVPLKFFSFVGGVAVGKDSLAYGDKTVKLSELPTSIIGGLTYVAAIECARALGLRADSFFESRYIFVGTDSEIEALKADGALRDAGAYALFPEYDVSSFKPEDYKAARTKWRISLVGSPEINDLSNPSVRDKIDSVNRRCKERWAAMHKDDPVILWGDAAPVESDQLMIQYGRIVSLAKGYATYGSDYYHDPKLLEDIKFALEWMYENMFGEAEIAGTGWRDVHLFNWWYWYIASPEALTDIMFMLEDEISLEDRKRYLKCWEWLATFMHTEDNAGLSRISVCTKVGIALEKPEYLKKENVDFDRLLVLKARGGGARVDYSDFTHNCPYNMRYGMLHLDRVLLVASMLSGTPLEYQSPLQYNQYGMARYMFEPAMYRGQGMLMFCGRSTFINEVDAGSDAIFNLLPMIGVFGEDEDRALKSLIKRNSKNDRVKRAVRSKCSFYTLSLYDSILEDGTYSYDEPYEYAHAWYTADRCAQHRGDYAVGIAMSSIRERNYESINSANKTGWYSGDGTFYLYTTYDDSSFDGKQFLMHNINVAYRYPGATSDERERVIRSVKTPCAHHYPTTFAGSIQIEDKYFAAGMDFISEHNEKPDTEPRDVDNYGATLPVHINDLKSKKAWFAFDNEIICLSAGITSTMDSPVNTTLDHRRIVHDEELSQYASVGGKIRKLDKKSGRVELGGADWILLEGHAGFVFLEDSAPYFNRYTHTPKNLSNTDRGFRNSDVGEADRDYFEIGIAHGKNPKNASYAYAVLPYATAETLDGYKASPDTLILSNTTSVQAAYDKSTRITAAVFHEGGVCESVGIKLGADAPSILTLSDKGDHILFGATDPTQEAALITYTVYGEYEVEPLDGNISVAYEDGNTRVTVDHTGTYSRPARARLKEKK